MCRPKHVEQLRNIGIINSTTRSHLVGSFYFKFLAVAAVGPCYHGMARPQVADGGTTSYMEGSCEYIE